MQLREAASVLMYGEPPAIVSGSPFSTTLVASNCSCWTGPACTLLFIMIMPVDAHQTTTVPAFHSRTSGGKHERFCGKPSNPETQNEGCGEMRNLA